MWLPFVPTIIGGLYWTYPYFVGAGIWGWTLFHWGF